MIRHFLTVATSIDAALLSELLPAIPGLSCAWIHRPCVVHDPFLDAPRPPALIIETAFAAIEFLEAAVSPRGGFAPLAGFEATQQAMLAREIPVPDARLRPPPGELPCSYMVAYEGMAEDLNLWLSRYIAGHPPLMARLPGIRGITLFTRIDWCSGIDWPRVSCMQRNKVVFDSPAALDAALQSPERAAMRADFLALPPFRGKVTHIPMTTLTLHPESDR